MKIQLFELSTNQEILEFEAVIKDGDIIAVKPNIQDYLEKLEFEALIEDGNIIAVKPKTKNYFITGLTTEESVKNATNKEMKTYFAGDGGERVYKMIVWLNF